MSAAPAPTPHWSRDWTQYLCPGPRRRFTPAEMARGGADAFPVGIGRYVGVNALAMVLAFGYAVQRGGVPAQLFVAAVIGATALMAMGFARSLWQQPTRLRLNVGSFGLMFGMAVVVGAGVATLENLGMPSRISGAIAGVTALNATMVVVGWYFLVLFRVEQIEGRLREHEAQDARDALQRRLATAQIHPHFVFNTLASLTHWVESGDARAAPLLREFNAYLRATLPMFEREQQSLAEELALVRHYLAIMQARLGERLQWSVQGEVPALALPPGSLLTLVENAVTHGIEPSLRGGRIELRLQPGLIEVANTGSPLEAGAAERLGLANTRERLLALHPGATLTLDSHPEGGCIARMSIPQ